MTNWTNKDGLQVPFGQDQARETQSVMGKTANNGPMGYMVVDMNWDDLPTFTADLNNDGTNNGFSDSDAYIPAKSYITRAYLIVEDKFLVGTDYDLGFYKQNGDTVDVDGLDAGVALADLELGEVVEMNGVLVGTLDTVGADDVYLVVVDKSTDFTAGKARIVIEYIQTGP